MRDDFHRKHDLIGDLFPLLELESSKIRYKALKGNESADRLPFILDSLGFDHLDDLIPKRMWVEWKLDECDRGSESKDCRIDECTQYYSAHGVFRKIADITGKRAGVVPRLSAGSLM